MLSKQERIDFRVKLVRQEKTLKQWCKDNEVNYNLLAQEINDHARLQEKHESKIRKYIGIEG